MQVIRWVNRHSAYGFYTVRQSMQHRFAFFMSLLSALIQPVILYFIWKQVFLGNTLVVGLNENEMLTYLIISQSINCMYGFQTSPERQIMNRVKTGDIALDLIKPANFAGARLFETLGLTVLQIAITAFFAAGAILAFPGFCFPPSLGIFFAFLVSVILGFFVLFFISLMLGMISFYTLNITGLLYGRKAVVDLLSGALVPISFMPAWIKSISTFLPFQGIIYTPTMIFLGKLAFHDILFNLLVQLIWVIILCLLSWIVYTRSMRRVTVHGG